MVLRCFVPTPVNIWLRRGFDEGAQCVERVYRAAQLMQSGVTCHMRSPLRAASHELICEDDGPLRHS